MVPNLRHYMVIPLALADSGFQMPTVHLHTYLHEWLPHLSAQLCATGVDAVLIRDENNIHACVRQEIEGYRQLIRLRQIGVTVESAFQHSPATVGWRDLPDGSSVWTWTAADHFGLDIDR